MKKIIVFLADGFEEIEAVTIINVLRRADVKVDICSLDKEFVRGAHDIYIKCDVNIHQIIDNYDGLYLPGGMPGSKNLMEHPIVQRIIKDYKEKGKLISAICAAPIALNEAGVLRGEKVTSFPGIEDQLQDVTYLKDPVVISNNIITSRGPATALLIAYEILDYLGLKEKSQKLKEEMLFDYLKENIDK